MNAKTLQALHGSIAKWQAVVDGTGENYGSNNCPLCKLFLNGEDECGGCPIRNKTGMRNCRGTPFKAYIKHKTIKNAQAELAFLKSLVPK